MTARRRKLMLNLALGVGVLAAVLAGRGYFVFTGAYSFAHDGVCITSRPGYHIAEQNDGDVVVWIVTKFTGQSALVGDEESYHHNYHYHGFVRLDDAAAAVDVRAKSEDELRNVSAMIHACGGATIPPASVSAAPKAPR
ncbi:hypothetical protein [Asticcacaulis sp. AC402]|uniref:hypothetical protein n=1 Tax=Asticcacaulis sp. AC402 TaxID=1282361 RepID=UPI0003C40B1F|nr:hypothetical protein [Asticcacaulis sp. AC402]ESQ74530.1 hypothetical protein ABAC402_13665 [Asticcacaulis sp. AC402]